MKHVVSVSIGSSRRDTDQVIDLLSHKIRIERRGTDGDMKAAAHLLRELDGKVDAFGLGGMDLYLYAGGRRYPIRDAVNLARHAVKTPIVCGAGLKRSLEQTIVQQLNDRIQWRGKKVLMVSALDRFGMAHAIEKAGADVVYGDLIFALGLPMPLRKARSLCRLARIFAPIVLKLPFTWLYPTGEKQERVEGAHNFRSRYFEQADLVAGDWHYIHRYAPRRLEGKTILTNTTTTEDIDWARRAGVKRLITTTPRFGGRSPGTNLLEAAFVALSEKFPLAPRDYRDLISRGRLGPQVLEFG